ncbi:hypothetical protein V490_01352 [Pseudogymnoascus sp. VKM F-3557]|nr:hypothetical protein V490_01352 [Pseudogymnoascus sp. VKM F-3557]
MDNVRRTSLVLENNLHRVPFQIIDRTGNGRIHDPAPYIAVPAKGSEALKSTLGPGESSFVATHILTVTEAGNILSELEPYFNPANCPPYTNHHTTTNSELEAFASASYKGRRIYINTTSLHCSRR